MSRVAANLARLAWQLQESLSLLAAIERENDNAVVNAHLEDLWVPLKEAFATCEHAREAERQVA